MVFRPVPLCDQNMSVFLPSIMFSLGDKMCVVQKQNLKLSICNIEKLWLTQLLELLYIITVSAPRETMCLLQAF